MGKKKGSGEQKQGPPLQFRPGVELEQMLAAFAGKHGLPLNDACKVLAALAVAELDCRFYPLVYQMSQAMGGPNAFPRSCDYIHISLEAGRRAAGHPLQLDPERASFIVGTVRHYVAGKGLPVDGVNLWFLPEGESPPAVPQEVQESLAGRVEQQGPQPNPLSGGGRGKRKAGIPRPQPQRVSEHADDEIDTSEGGQSVQGAQEARREPAR